MNTDEVSRWVCDYGVWIALIIGYPVWYRLGIKLRHLIKPNPGNRKIIVRHVHNGVVQRTVEIDNPRPNGETK